MFLSGTKLEKNDNLVKEPEVQVTVGEAEFRHPLTRSQTELHYP